MIGDSLMSMAVLAALLALGGGLVLAATFVADLPDTLVALALVAWLAALAIVVLDAMVRARREHRSTMSALRSGLREAGRFLRQLTP